VSHCSLDPRVHIVVTLDRGGRPASYALKRLNLPVSHRH
jgi:hypothetical protein